MADHSQAQPTDKNLTFTISSAGDDAEFAFPKTAKIADVIEAARVKFTLSATDKYTLAFIASPKDTFDLNRTLVSYHVADDAELLLTSHGGGV